jgi:hypothetical protein
MMPLVLQAEEDAAEVDDDDPVPFLLGDLGGRLGLLLGAGVVEGVVEASERLDGVVERCLHVVAPGHVAADGNRLAAQVGDHGSGFVVALLVDVGDRDTGAPLGERRCGDPSDAAGRAGDERHLSCQVAVLIGHACSLPSSCSGCGFSWPRAGWWRR